MLEVLGVLVAFIAVILLLSVFVTTAAHFTQSVLRLRGRSLVRGIAELLPAVSSVGGGEADRIARRICAAPTVDPARGVVVSRHSPTGDPVMGWLRGFVFGSARPSITPDELAEAVVAVATEHRKVIPLPPSTVMPSAALAAPAAAAAAEAEEAEAVDPAPQAAAPPAGAAPARAPLSPADNAALRDAAVKARVAELYPRMLRASKQRYAFWMRILAVAWALAIAIGYQLSTPDLITRLSSDADMRAAAEALASRQLAGPAPAADADTDANADDDRDADGDVDEADVAVLRAELAAHRNALAGLNLTPWARGRAYYLHDGGLDAGAVLGVLMTAILLALGAPFWYERLKNISGLRDALMPRSTAAPEKPARERSPTT